MSIDLYKVLGVEKSASAQEIKRAFREKASENHPDTNPDRGDMMALINGAYRVLKDPEKRKIYDETGQVHQNSREDRIQTILHEFLFKVAEGCDTMDQALKQTESMMIDVIRKGNASLDDNKRKIRILEKKRKAYVYKGKSPDIFGAKLEDQIDSLQKTNQNLKEELSLVEEASKLLKDYEALDQQEVRPMSHYEQALQAAQMGMYGDFENNPFNKYKNPFRSNVP